MVTVEKEIETIYSSSTNSDSMSESGDMYHEGIPDQMKEPGTSRLVDPPSYQLEFNIKLKYDYTNAWGVEIFHDPMLRHVYKTADCPTPFEQFPRVNYQGDMYVGNDGARYEVTKHPQLIDAIGLLHTQIDAAKVTSPCNKGLEENLKRLLKDLKDQVSQPTRLMHWMMK